MKHRTLTALLFLALQTPTVPSFAANDSTPTADINQLLTMLSGDFDNHLQMRFKTDEEKAASKTNHHEGMSMARTRVLSEHLPGHWLFAQTNKTDDNNKVYRQTVLEFFVNDDNSIQSRVWRITDPTVTKPNTPSKAFLKELSKENLVQVMPDSCLMQWEKNGDHFVGSIDADRCVIQSKYKDEKRKLFAEEIVFDSGNWVREGAYSADGSLIFGLDKAHYYRFQKHEKTED